MKPNSPGFLVGLLTLATALTLACSTAVCAEEIVPSIQLPEIPDRGGVVEHTFVLEEIEGPTLENVVIGDQRVDGRLDWRKSAP